MAASDHQVFPDVQSKDTAWGASRQGRPSPTQQLPTGRPFSAANHSRLPSDSSKSNTVEPPRSQSTMQCYPEQFYIDKNFDIDKALEYWGLWDSEIKLDGLPDINQKLSRSSLFLCTNRKAPNPGLKRAADLTDFIFNPDCPECRSAVWPTSQPPTNKSPFSFHKSQNSWSTVSTEDSSDLTPGSSYSSSSCALASTQRPTMCDQTAPDGRFSPGAPQPQAQPQPMPEDPPKMSHRLSRPAPSFPADEYFVVPLPSPPDNSSLCPDCSATAPSTRGRRLESPSHPSPRRHGRTHSSASSAHKPRASADSLPRLSTARTNSTSQDRATRFSPSRPAPKPTAAQRSDSRSISRPASSRKNTHTTAPDPTPPASSELSPDRLRERSVWESDSDSEDGSKFGMSSLRKVKSKITLRRVNRSTSRLSMAVDDDTVPPLPSNIALSFSKKNASTGSIQPVREVLRKREPAVRSPSPLPVSQAAKTPEKFDAGKSPMPTSDTLPRQKLVKKVPEQPKCNATEVTTQAAVRFYSCSQTQTDINLILPHQKGIKQAWGAIRSRMKFLACNKIRNATGQIDVSEKSEKD